MRRFRFSAPSVQATPDSRYTVTASKPNCDDRYRATSGANAAPMIQARSADRAASV